MRVGDEERALATGEAVMAGSGEVHGIENDSDAAAGRADVHVAAAGEALIASAALTIAGSDPTGGAGLQLDLQVFALHGVHGMAVPTALTVQTTVGVKRTARSSRAWSRSS